MSSGIGSKSPRRTGSPFPVPAADPVLRPSRPSRHRRDTPRSRETLPGRPARPGLRPRLLDLGRSGASPSPSPAPQPLDDQPVGAPGQGKVTGQPRLFSAPESYTCAAGSARTLPSVRCGQTPGGTSESAGDSGLRVGETSRTSSTGSHRRPSARGITSESAGDSGLRVGGNLSPGTHRRRPAHRRRGDNIGGCPAIQACVSAVISHRGHIGDVPDIEYRESPTT
ncbi:hypothetical protein Bbelb_288930 [Branchiostoma belcheri]|nr:hypothetical protein Bbelb_288930 [Branchiostoma belcheri]